MSLVMGTGPFGGAPAGHFAAEGVTAGTRTAYLEASPKRVRAVVDGRTVADSRSPRLMHEPDAMPRWWFPADDVDAGDLDLERGEGLTEGLLAVPDGVDVAWWEDDEEQVGQPRDPFHRVDTRRSESHVVVRVGVEIVAESRRAVRLYETSLPPRWYLPREDVADGVLGPSGLHTTCPYKGVASYRSVTGGGTTVADAAWYYPEPFAEAAQVQGYLSFLGEGVDVIVDGEPVS